jgi:hypothetical protein
MMPLSQRKGASLGLPERPTYRHPRPAGPTADTVVKVLERDRGCCVVCGLPVLGERGWDWSVHHRRGRDGRPDSHTLANLILVCGNDNQSGCHGIIHQRRSVARPNGWWLSRSAGEDPLTVPIRYQGRPDLVWLTATGISNQPPAPEGVAA